MGSRFIRTVLALAACAVLPGCATRQLADMTVRQGDSTTDIEYRMVLANLALYRSYRPNALEDSPLPWHLKITQGSAEVVDTLNPTFGQTLVAPEETFGLSVSRGVTVNWTFAPEIDTDHLTKLRQLYFDATRDAIFAADFQQGQFPEGKPFGRYQALYVWPKPGHIGALTVLALKVLADTPAEAEDKPVLLPGPIR
jgi:hypothetical protein